MADNLNGKYFHNKGFDQKKLQEGVLGFLPKHQPGYAPTAAECALTLINRLGADVRVTDLRYMAYMLATACHEAREIKKFLLPKVVKGKVLVDAKTKQPIMGERHLWTLFNPIDEAGHGKGRDYFEAVKVQALEDGALVTEKDGDQFKINAQGVIQRGRGLSGPTAVGSPSGGAPSKKYQDAPGDEHQYYGRGLVQITWWNGYAKSGVDFGFGLELLLNPERVKDYNVAYAIMVQGMTTGGGYANGKKCSQFFTAAQTDYVSARAMVNGSDKAQAIADLAIAFEAILLDARLQ